MEKETVTIATRCGRCGDSYELVIPTHEWEAYIGGKLIQDALPSLTAGERELLLSHTCDACWRNIFRIELNSRWEGQ